MLVICRVFELLIKFLVCLEFGGDLRFELLNLSDALDEAGCGDVLPVAEGGASNELELDLGRLDNLENSGVNFKIHLINQLRS